MGGMLPLVGEHRKVAYHMLHQVGRILDEEGIPYVLEAGTLLGVVREQRLLPWDTDLDLTVTADHADALLAARWRFWAAGFRTRIRRFPRDMGPFARGMPRVLKIQTRRWLVRKGHSLMDIFVKYRVEDTYQWVVADRDPVLKRCPARFYDQRSRVGFDGAEFSIPEDAEGYLAYHYGSDWRTPVRSWDFRWDDHCAKEPL